MEEREFNYINVIPLVDIMLVLLTIVLTTATFIVQGEIPLTLPQAESAEKKRTYRALEISITKEGRILLGRREVSLKKLLQELSSVERKRPINLRADAKTEVQNLVSVIDVLNKLGFENVNLVVKKE